MTEQELEQERRIDDDHAVVAHFYAAKRRYPNIPFYLQDERGNTFESVSYTHLTLPTICSV